MKYDIFISYKRLDKDKVFPIKDFIERNTGYNCWIDLDGIESDAQFADIIIKAINNAEVFLFMYSKTHSKIENFEEDWTVREISFAQIKKKRIVFVNLDNTPLTDRFYFMFSTKQQVAATSDVAMKKLCADIKQWLRNEDEERLEQERIEREKREAEAKRKNAGIQKSVSNMVNGHEYVDLGLPSGLKWATCNVGANKPEDCGDYFAWGETETKTEYSEGNSLTREHSISELRRRGIVDGNIRLTSSYDAARAKWGGSWRMPTKEELEELEENCRWEWSTQNGVKGYKVTGPNGNSIFLPAAGIRIGTSLSNDGINGYYSSTTSYDFYDYDAWCLYFNDSDEFLSYYGRDYGLTVRPITE